MGKDDFIKNIVFGWMESDIKRMVKEIPTEDGKIGNINFPLALYILVCIEYLGGFLLGKEGDYTSNTKEYINKCFKTKNEYCTDILRDFFRNGLAHSYGRGAISRANIRPAIYFKDKNLPLLDVETLASDFLGSLNEFKQQLNDENYKKRMDQELQKIKHLKEKHKDKIEDLKTKNGSTVEISSANVSYPNGPFKNTTTIPYNDEDRKEV